MYKKLLVTLAAICSCTVVSAADLLLYAQKNGEYVYLGCFTCGKANPESVWNFTGKYGSSYSDTSIWNSYCDFGNKFSYTGPWSRASITPPVLVDRGGHIRGYFTCTTRSNRLFPRETDILCENLESYRLNPGRFYEAYFRDKFR